MLEATDLALSPFLQLLAVLSTKIRVWQRFTQVGQLLMYASRINFPVMVLIIKKFFQDRLRVTDDTLLGHFKAHV